MGFLNLIKLNISKNMDIKERFILIVLLIDSNRWCNFQLKGSNYVLQILLVICVEYITVRYTFILLKTKSEEVVVLRLVWENIFASTLSYNYKNATLCSFCFCISCCVLYFTIVVLQVSANPNIKTWTFSQNQKQVLKF